LVATLGEQLEDTLIMNVSLVVPVRNEEQSLPRLLESIRQQTLQPAEIILVDGGSSDNTVELARCAAEGDSRLRVIEAGPAYPGRGRNLGIEAASHDWVALTDAGIRLEPTWLESLVEVVEANPSTDVVYGNVESVVDSWFTRCAALAYLTPKVARPGGSMRGPFIASSILRREVCLKIGGFPNLRAGEDLIFMDRIMEAGYAVAWAPQAIVWWQLQPNLTQTFRRFTLYSKHNVFGGRQWDWHYGIARQYAVAAVFLILAIVHSLWWLVVPVLGFGMRVFLSVWRRRDERGLLWALNPAQLASVGVILLTIDLATFVGWAQAIKKRAAGKQLKNPADS
jgi:glycosyltransferase involved in cell wall biosynthesis